ncbi:glutaredoxin family protein [Halomonas sp. CUBES01]|uniref:Glutaredoxin family protein n=1 Tax=Vreelandella gomseomensis TaxID=370766 RepID=A0ABU1GG28_9GAMM|nr:MULTISPECIES: glutaredoxin family protein [Halomonas]MDR5876431.1 glutaredoxin family protein [Halomonas gomseomensis]MEC4766809.1 glutaredoxin family protein [Halomonas sp. CUBES01]
MIRLTLYTTEGCHLCAELEARVAALTLRPVAWQRVEVSEDETLLARYGEHIPVLADEAGRELAGSIELVHLSDWLRARGWLDEAALEALTEAGTVSPPKGVHQRRGRRFLG